MNLLLATLLVVSVDGLDQRYLEDADRLGLKIPNLRKLMREGEWSRGVLGIVPTVTWPSHTTLITGATAEEHGILSNRRPASEGGDYYWDVNLLKRPTLLDEAAKAAKTTAVITWPVTVNAPVTYNLPEYFKKRRGGAMDTPSICAKAKPANLCAQIASRFPSFRQEWMDDRTRTLAVRYFLAQPTDIVLVHLVDLDSEAHETGPFSIESNALLEYTDELIGTMAAALPKGGRLVVVSDHGFEAAKSEVHLRAEAPRGVRPMGGFVLAEDDEAAAWLRSAKKDSKYGLGREIPADEIQRLAPHLAGAKMILESAEGVWFGFGNVKLLQQPRETGNHGHWPTRYRAVYLAWGKGLRAQRTPEVPMQQIYERLRSLSGLSSTIEIR
ncbi:MAG: ectonucleotide pyrophosphatase/phosphodiesterase [Acidobacteria bacterium]|nr:ectonucleotide pyrophosphatase/phosphodiesterase [Acidobacteriota bacterium]